MADDSLIHFRRTRTRHGQSKTRIYSVWQTMLQRCYNPNHRDYRYYGGRGIEVCERWRNDFRAYLASVVELGPRPSPQHTIDRVDNDGNYEPGNIRWATREEQSANKRPKTYADYDDMMDVGKRTAEDAAFEWQMALLKELSQALRDGRELPHLLRPTPYHRRVLPDIKPEDAVSPADNDDEYNWDDLFS